MSIVPLAAIILIGDVRAAPNIDAMCPRMLHQVFEDYVPYGMYIWPFMHGLCVRQIDIPVTVSADNNTPTTSRARSLHMIV